MPEQNQSDTSDRLRDIINLLGAGGAAGAAAKVAPAAINLLPMGKIRAPSKPFARPYDFYRMLDDQINNAEVGQLGGKTRAAYRLDAPHDEFRITHFDTYPNFVNSPANRQSILDALKGYYPNSRRFSRNYYGGDSGDVVVRANPTPPLTNEGNVQSLFPHTGNMNKFEIGEHMINMDPKLIEIYRRNLLRRNMDPSERNVLEHAMQNQYNPYADPLFR